MPARAYKTNFDCLRGAKIVPLMKKQGKTVSIVNFTIFHEEVF